jgi:hypothetical protein
MRSIISNAIKLLSTFILFCVPFVSSCMDANVGPGLHQYLIAIADNQTILLNKSISKYEPEAAKLSEYQLEHARLIRFLYGFHNAKLKLDFIRDAKTGNVTAMTIGGIDTKTWESNGFESEFAGMGIDRNYYCRLLLKPDFRDKYSNEAIQFNGLILNAKLCSDKIRTLKEDARSINMMCGFWESVNAQCSVSKCQGGYLITGDGLGIADNIASKGTWYYDANTNTYTPSDEFSNLLYIKLTRPVD